MLELRTLETPVPPEGEVLVRVHAATVTPGDCEIRGFRLAWWVWVPLRLYMGVVRPRRPVLGMEFSGVVAAVGPRVTAGRSAMRCSEARALASAPTRSTVPTLLPS